MNKENPQLNFEWFKETFIPQFREQLIKNNNISMSLKYKLPHKMLLKADPCDFTHALPSTFEKKTPIFEQVCADEDWIIALKLFHLIRSLENKKKCRDVANGFYFLIDTLPSFKKPWELVNSDFARASNRTDLSPGLTYRLGAGLACIGKTLKKYNLSPEKIRYLQNPHIRPQRSAKTFLPNLEACKVLAESFKSPLNGFEILVSSAFALLNYAPSRGSEILTLDVDCITTLNGFGLCFPRPAKNGKSTVKRAPCIEFEKVVTEACRKLNEFGESARNASAWYRKNESIYIPEDLEHLKGKEEYSIQEALAIIGYKRSDNNYSQPLYFNRPKSPPAAMMPPGLNRLFQSKSGVYYRDTKIRLDDESFISASNLYKWATNNLSPTFPFIDGVSQVKYEDCLFVYPYASRTPYTKTYWQCENVPCFFTTTKLQQWFGRLFFRGRNREDLSLGTHAMRHLLNTLAQSKHIDQRLIAIWSGRSSVEQNSSYDHRTPTDKIDLVDENANGSGFEFGGFLDELYEDEYKPTGVSTEDFFRNVIGSLHVTELGLCRHDYNSGPCPNIFQCIDCSEHCFKKGDERSLAVAHRMIAKLTPVIEAAQIAVNSGEPGAEKFLNSHKRKISRYKKQIDICSDPMISSEALCALPPSTQTDNIVSKALALRDNNTKQLKQNLYERGRIGHCDIDRETVDLFNSLMTSWTVDRGLPTWDNVCETFRDKHDIQIKHQFIKCNKEMARSYEIMSKQLLENNLVKRDSSSRWYWNTEYIVSHILDNWHFESLGSPSLSKVTQYIQEKYPYAKTTPMALQKNLKTRKLLSDKLLDLYAKGMIFLSANGWVICERKMTSQHSTYFNIHESFNAFAEDWGIKDGLPFVDIILKKFSEKTGFTFRKSYLFSDKKLFESLNRIKESALNTGFVNYSKSNVPSWNVGRIVSSYCINTNGTLKTDHINEMYNNIIFLFPGIKLNERDFLRTLKTQLHEDFE